jgi:hypothetical protein
MSWLRWKAEEIKDLIILKYIYGITNKKISAGLSNYYETNRSVASVSSQLQLLKKQYGVDSKDSYIRFILETNNTDKDNIKSESILRDLLHKVSLYSEYSFKYGEIINERQNRRL